MDRTPVIAGIGLSDYPVAPDLDSVQHHALAMQRALADCGVEKSAIDAYIGAGGSHQMMVDDPVTLAEYFRIDHKYIDGTMTGGPQAYEAPYGNSLVGAYAMAAQRHMHEYGTTMEQLGEIAAGVREFAGLNPNAMYRDPITADDVVSSRMIADPLHKLDCCVISDGGGALIMTTAERAKDLKQPPAYVLCAAGAQTHWNISQMPDYTVTSGAKAGPIAFEQAGVTPADIDTIHFYDSFTITALLLLEDLGFCPKGEGGKFVQEGHLRRGGDLPLNTDGGGLSSCHPGMRGICLLIESVRRLRGPAGEAQVPDCNLALACGSGGWLSCIGTVILGKEHP